MADASFVRVVRCWHAQAARLAGLAAEGEMSTWEETVAAYREAGEALALQDMQVAARRAQGAAAPDRPRYARALRGAATRAARDAVDRRRSAARRLGSDPENLPAAPTLDPAPRSA